MGNNQSQSTSRIPPTTKAHGIPSKFILISKLGRGIALALSLVFALGGTSIAKERGRIIEGTVTKVSDGDTIQITDQVGTKVKVRFYGMDAPETEKINKRTGVVSKAGQPAGEDAYQSLKRKIDRQVVKVEVIDVDRYGRTVGIVWLGNRNVNLEMVAEGWAWAYRQYLNRPHASEYIGLEERARAARKGIWTQHNPQPPWEFRKLQR